MATIKQKRAVKALVGNGGNVTRAMLEAGYRPATANTPQKLTESEGWKELMGKHLSDEYLAKRHRELLEKNEVKFAKQGDEYVPVETLDVQAVSKGLDMAYKLKGSYAAEKTQNLNVNINATPEDIDKFRKLREEYEQKLLNEISE